MIIQIDSREKAKAITKILEEFKKQEVQCFVSKLFVGDYVSLDNSRLVVDRKQNLAELYINQKRMLSEKKIKKKDRKSLKKTKKA